MTRDWEARRSDITKAAITPDRPVADRLGRSTEVQTTDFQDVVACFRPILLFWSRGTSEQRGQPVGGNVYAGFELELAGVERYREQETRDDTESAATNVLNVTPPPKGKVRRAAYWFAAGSTVMLVGAPFSLIEPNG